jgi:hypothetical protein
MNYNNSISRKSVTHQLSELIDDVRFNPYKPQDQANCRQTSAKKYRIPEHQRFNDRWSKTMRERLIDSVMSDFPIHAMVLSTHYEHVGDEVVEYFNVQDGQQRLTTLYNFMEGKCDTTYDDKTFAEFSVDEKAKYRAYAVPCQEISKKAGITQEEYANVLTDIFERLNSGKPLSDNEKYHARRGEPAVKYATHDLPNLPGLKAGFDMFVGPIGTGKEFKMMGDMVGAVLTIIKGSGNHLTTSFVRNFKNLSEVISEANKEKVQSIFADWFRILNLAYTNDNSTPLIVKPLKIAKRYGKLSGPFALFIIWKRLQTEGITDECWAWTIQNWNLCEFQDNVFRELSLNAWGMRNAEWAGEDGLKKKLVELAKYYHANACPQYNLTPQYNLVQPQTLRAIQSTIAKHNHAEDDNISELSASSLEQLDEDLSSISMELTNSGSKKKRNLVKRVGPGEYYKCFEKDTRLKLELTKAHIIYGKVSILAKRIISNAPLTYEKNGTKYEDAVQFTTFNDWVTCYALHILNVGGTVGKKSAYNAIYYENDDGEWTSIDELTRL